MTRLAQIAVVLCFAALNLPRAVAQDIRHGVITGVVLTADSAPVVGAIVTLDSSLAQVSSDSAGAFAFRNVVVGRHLVSARRLGFATGRLEAAVTTGELATLVFRLEPTPHVLPEVEVRGRKVIDVPRFTAAVERANRNNGAVFTADDIAKENPLDTKSLLGRLPGVHVNDRGLMFDRCQDSGMLPGPGSGGSGRGARSSFQPASGPTVRVQVYVDGKRMTYDGNTGGDFAPDDANNTLKLINPRNIAVMEVYTGIARIPVEYLADACAVIAIWTKAY